MSTARSLEIKGISKRYGENSNNVLASAELYDPRTGEFSPTGLMSTPRAIPTATLLSDGRVLIAGGYATMSGSALGTAELYDPRTGTFTTSGSMTTPRMGQAAVRLVDGRVLIAGGSLNCGAQSCDVLSSAELYDPHAGTFSATGTMAVAVSGPCAVLLPDGGVLVAGGASGQTVLDTAEVFR